MNKSKKTHGMGRKKKSIIIILILLAVATLGVLGWGYYQQNKKSSSDVSTDDALHAANVGTMAVDARKYIDSKDIKAGSVYYDEKVQQADDDIVKRQLLIAKVDYLLQAKANAEAVEVAKIAVEKYGKESDAHAALARAYEVNGQKQEALVEYKQALVLLTTDQPPSRTNPRLIYESKIKELEA